MVHITRKKKETRKYETRNEFRFNFSPHAKGHPQYIFGKKGDKYKGLPLTTSPVEKIRHVALKSNPDPHGKKPSYLEIRKPDTAHERYYSDPLKGWKFAKEDMPFVRHRIKIYKKSMNRKPPMWYEKKKKK